MRSARRGRDSDCATRAARGLPPVGVGAILPSNPVRVGLHPGSQPGGSGTDRSRGCRASWEGTGRPRSGGRERGLFGRPNGARLHCSRNGCSARRLPAVDSPIDSRGIGYCNCGALGPRRLSPAAPAFPAGRNPVDPASVCIRGNSMARTWDGAAAPSRRAPAPDRKRGGLTLRPADGRRHRDRTSPCTAMRRSKGRTRARTGGSPIAVGAPRRYGPDLRPCRLAPRSRSPNPG